MGIATPVTSPWVEIFSDYIGRAIQITVTFNESTRQVTGVTVYRDVGCLFTKILVGVGPDGVPDNTSKSVTVPEGTTVLTAQQLAALANKGLSSIEDFAETQITAGR